MDLVGRDEHHVAGARIGQGISQPDLDVAVQDHDRVFMGMVLKGRGATNRDREVAQLDLSGAVSAAHQDSPLGA